VNVVPVPNPAAKESPNATYPFWIGFAPALLCSEVMSVEFKGTAQAGKTSEDNMGSSTDDASTK
jgi:hypothetical protein